MSARVGFLMQSRVVRILLAATVFFFALAGSRTSRNVAQDTSSSQAGTGSQTPTGVPSGDMCTWWGDPAASADSALPSPLGGELPAVRYVMDPYPTFNGIAVDPRNNRVMMTDENRKSVLVYDRASGSMSSAITSPLGQVTGPQTQIGYISSVELDPVRREFYVVNSDIEDRIVVFDYDANGDAKPKRRLYTPHQAWGIALNSAEDVFAITAQQIDTIEFYRREATNLERPLRVITGPHTGMADPHGLRWDVKHHELIVANHGNYSVITPYSAYDVARTDTSLAVGGHFRLPSITVYAESAGYDARPLRTIQGSKTQLNWPMGIDFDATHDEIAVANNGDSSVLIFRRTADGNVAPERIIRGPHTGIADPMGVAIDTKNDELWVANYGDHTAVVFSRTASGDAAPKRIIRNAPAGTPTGGFGNPYAVAYDSKRDQLLVPN